MKRAFPLFLLAATLVLSSLAAISPAPCHAKPSPDPVTCAPVHHRLLGTIGNGYTRTSTLVELDRATGALLQTIGPVGYLVNGLDYDPISDTLYASTASHDFTFPAGLLTIDPTTGAGTPVGNGFGRNVTNVHADLKGNLFGWTEYGPGFSDDLVSIDPQTGLATGVGESFMGTYAYGMSFNSSGTLYFVNGSGDIWTVDTVSGAGSYTGMYLGQTAHHGDFDPVTDKYWGISPHPADTSARGLLEVDVNAGTIVQSLPTVDNLHTLTFYYPPQTNLFAAVRNDSGTSDLVELDPADGTLAQTIGPVGYLVNGLDYDPATCRMYASTSRFDPHFANGLLTIDLNTGEGTPVGSGLGLNVTNLRADASGHLFGWADDLNDLVAVNPADGTASVVGDSGVSTWAEGLSFDSAGTLYLVNYTGKIYAVDPSNGAAAYTGKTLGWIALNGDVHPSTGLYWGIDTPWGPPTNLKLADLASGTVTQLLPTELQLQALAFTPGSFLTVTPVAGAGGSVDPGTPTTVRTNESTAFTITPDSGYAIVSVSGCGGTLYGNTYITGPVTADCTFTVTFGEQVAAPTSINVSNTGSSYLYSSVSWGRSPTSGVTYELERSTNGGDYGQVYSGTATSFRRWLPAADYRYRVRAVKPGFAPSEWVGDRVRID